MNFELLTVIARKAGQDPGPALMDALAAAHTLTDPRERSEALVGIAQAMAAAGQDPGPALMDALAAAHTIPAPKQRGYVLERIARAQTEMDLVTDAVRSLEMVPVSSESGTLWLHVAQKAFNSGHKGLARRAAARALAVSSWETTIGTVTMIEPGLWTMIENFDRAGR
jgi:hypothetical protein